VILLATKAFPQISAMPNTGMLFQPRCISDPTPYEDAGIPFAADNDAFQGWDDEAAGRWLKMLGTLVGHSPLFVTCPDVVGDHDATVELWEWWSGTIQACGLPAAFVLQDGCIDISQVPDTADALFIGGTDRYKLSPEAAAIVGQFDGWKHCGRVNTLRRIEYASSIGCDSFDGTAVSKWWDVYAQRFAAAAALPPQGVLVGPTEADFEEAVDKGWV
jgi:hypothetical protein